MKNHLIYHLCILIFLVTKIYAKPYCFRSYEVEDGLSNNNVTCCVQDNYGFMWFGTRDGLNRFDGNKFHVIKTKALLDGALLSSWITNLEVSPNGELWVGTNMGVQRYDYQTDKFLTLKFTQGFNCVCIKSDHQGNLWMLLSGFSLIKYNVQSELHQVYMYKATDQITSFYITSQDQVWATTSNGSVVYLDSINNKFTPLNIHDDNGVLPIYNITSLWVSPSENILLLGTADNGLKRVDIKTGVCSNILTHQKSNPLNTRDIFSVTNDEVWIATYNGIYIYRYQTNSIYHIKHNKSDLYSLSSNAVKQIFKDREGGLWVCTDNGGINYLPPYLKFNKDYTIPGENTISGDIIHDICQDASLNIWIGTEDAGLNKFDVHKQTYTNFQDEDGLSQNCIHGLVVVDSYLWIGTHSNGIDVMDLRTEKIIRHYTISKNSHDIQNDIIVYLYKTRANDILVATASGVYLYNPDKDCFELLSQFPSKYRVQTIFEDSAGVIWAGTFNAGLYYYDPIQKKQGELKLDSIYTSANKTINHIHEDSDNNLWLATGNGVKIYNIESKKTMLYTMQEGLPSDVVYRIEEDSDGNMWISTANGLAVLNPANREIKVFKKEHGILSNQFNYNSSFKSDNGEFYFGTLKGLLRFNPNNIHMCSSQPKIYMTQINYSDLNHNIFRQEDITFKNEITLQYNQSTFYIEYTSLNYQAPNLSKYSYCMEGLSSNWYNLVGENRVYFTKLPPGNYTFKVKGQNISGIWNDQPSTFRIKILPPWWRSSFALLFYVIITIGGVIILILLMFRYNKDSIRKQLQEFEHEKEKELYQAKIDFFINIAHEIRTPLTLIKSPLERVIDDQDLSLSARNYLTIVNKNANRLLNLVNQLLDFRKTEVKGYRLNFVQIDIIALMKETIERFQDTVEQQKLHMIIEYNVESFFVFIDKEACIKILSNLLSNAIKYAKSKIFICIDKYGNNQFIIDVKNDGKPISDEIKDKIFEPFYRDESSIHKSGTGLGLPLARSLAEMHGGSLTLEESSAGLITFRLCLPVNQPNFLKLDEHEFQDKNIIVNDEKYITQESRPTILVVEDNAEMLHYIAHELNTQYNIITACNGKEAINYLKEYAIQLIISDIMMPIMDGFSLLKNVKTDLEFSHIPVVLLTAKNTLQSRLEGLELGADAYIEKPFSVDLLLKQVSNLLNNRKQMCAYYFNSPLSNIKSIAYTKTDERFLKKLNDIIENHINDVNLDVDMIADLMNLSRPTFYRKISALSNLTPNELIKISRLKKAAQLILQGDMKIYEISEAVGFNSQSYFSRAFSKQFNMTPSQYAKKFADRDTVISTEDNDLT